MDIILGFAVGGLLGVLAVIGGNLGVWISGRNSLKLKELEVRELEAKAALAKQPVRETDPF